VYLEVIKWNMSYPNAGAFFERKEMLAQRMGA
jgi:hypothetical protein